MLLPRWQQTLDRHGDAIAIHDGGRAIRFAEIDAALARLPRATAPVIATGSALEIIVSTLQAWRDDQPLVPVERPDAALPDLSPFLPGSALKPDFPVAHIKLTPGNDGRPRGVWFTASQILADADRLTSAMGLSPAMPNLATLSLTHSYGYSSIVLPLLLHGVPMQTVEVPFPAALVEAWSGHERIVLPAVPSMWRAWHRSGILRDAPIALALSAGAPLSLDLEVAIWENHRLKLHNFYGCSECGGISFDATDVPRSHPTDLGTPLPGVTVQVSADGRFVIHSDAVAQCYESTRDGEILGDGRFLTSDLGVVEKGRLIMATRGGDHINVAGRKLGPGRIEDALKSTGLVGQVRVFALPSADPERVEEVAAILPAGTDVMALRLAATASLATWEIPRHWFVAESPADFQLPRTRLTSRHRVN
ncbi:MAG: AMP-binding protein [Akkermansiaceae bacterium]|jgi:acyl-coenzyme A synthetase/AMP-(fatty) acid ligase|nr:AMP-binding protein [Akkermansiaceae bacterium]